MWSYDATDLNTTTSSGRLNSVRLLVGDNDVTDQIIQDEEITFSLAQANDNIYSAASYVAGLIAAKYSRLIDVQLDGALEERYSTLANQYRKLQKELKVTGQRYGGTSLGVSAGGINVSEVVSAEEDTTRVQPAFTMMQFDSENVDDTLYDD